VATPLLEIAVVTAVAAALIAWTGPATRWAIRRRRNRRAALHPESLRRPIQVVAADVRRLGRQIALVPSGAPMARRRALTAAYEDVLIEAAVLLNVPSDLPTTPVGPHRDAARRRLLADLEEAGLAVHA
jgi:hypothetical protein